MGTARSARGEMIDFDLIKIKQSLVDAAASQVEIKPKSNFIDKRLSKKILKGKLQHRIPSVDVPPKTTENK